MVTDKDVRYAIEILQMYCKEKQFCTNCKFKYVPNGGNAYYCGLTKTNKFNPILWLELLEGER